MATNSKEDKKMCDNHPDRPATFVSTLGGAVQEIHLCEQCASVDTLKPFYDVR